MRTFGILLLVATACTPEGDPDDTGNDTEDTDTGGDDTDTETGPTGEAHGTVVDGSGTPVALAKVNLCQVVCTTRTTDAYGAFDYDPLPVGDYSLHIVPPENSGLAEPLGVFTIEEYADPAIPVVLPALGADVTLPVSAAELEVAPALFLTLKAGDLEIVFVEEPPTAVSGALVDAADQLPIDLPGDVIAVWYLAPYEAAAVDEIDGIPLRIRNDFGLADGTYEVWRASYVDYSYVKVGNFEAAGGQITNSAARIPELTTLVLLDPDDVSDPYGY